MVGFSPLASVTLGDDGGVINYELVASNIDAQPVLISSTALTQDHSLGVVSFVTGSPLLQTTSLTQDHSLTSISLVFGAPILGSPSVTQEHNLLVTDLISGTPELANVNVTQDHGLTALGLTLGSPIVSDATMAEDETFSAPPLDTGDVVVEDTSISQDHSVTATSIVSLTPELIEAGLTQDHNLLFTEFTLGSPQVGQVDLTESIAQNNTLLARDILTGRPVVEDATNPDLILTQEIDQMFGGWQRRTYEVPDGRLVQSEREIQATYGDVVSIDRKAKSLLKFGKSAPLTTNTLETVWTVGGNEVYLSDDGITHISSSSASDTQEIRVEGHTISGDDLTFVVQLVTLSGQTPVALNTGLARVSRISNNNGTELVGRVVVYEDTAVTGGIPTDATKIHIDIPLGFQQSFKAATSFSKEDYYVMTGFYGAVSAKQSAAVDFYIEIKEPDGVFLQKACFTASSSGGNSDISLDPAIIVPKNSDVRVRCETTDNNAVVFGIFKGYLAKVTS
jgi:hypothetical protein